MTTVAEPRSSAQKLTWQLLRVDPEAWMYSPPGIEPPIPLWVRSADVAWTPDGPPVHPHEAVKHPALHYAGYIGRVGVLAAALGAGAAMAGAPGIAWAEPAEPDTAPSVSSGVESTETRRVGETAETGSHPTSDNAETTSQTGSEVENESEDDRDAADDIESVEDAAAVDDNQSVEDGAAVSSATDETESVADDASTGEPRTEDGAAAVELPAASAVTPELPEEAAPAPTVPADAGNVAPAPAGDTEMLPRTEADGPLEPEANRAESMVVPLTTPASPAARAAETPVHWGVFDWLRRASANPRTTLSYDPSTTSQVDNTLTGHVSVISRGGDSVTLTASPPVNGGTVVVNPDGTFTYTMPETMHATGGTDTFTITVGDAQSRRGLLKLVPSRLVRRRHAAVTTISLAVAPLDSTGAVSGTVHAAGPDLDTLTYRITGGPVNGAVSLDAITGAFTYTPDAPTGRHAAADQLADDFTVTVDDGKGGVVRVPVTVNIDRANTSPTVTLVASDPGSASTVHVTVTVGDPDIDPVARVFVHDPGAYDASRSQVAQSAATALTVTTTTMAAAPAATATANMPGTFGIGPRYDTITAPGGGTLAGDELRFNTFPSQSGINSAYEVQGEWLESIKNASLEPGETPTLVTFSMSTHAVVGRLRTDPDSLRGIRLIMLGAPETPGNPNDGNGYQNTEGLPTTGDLSNVTMVVVQYDPVADAAVRPNYWTRLNARMATHMYGYNGLDLNQPDAVRVDPVTGATVLYFRSDVLPMLKWLDPWVSDEKMAELDAKYRPLIEAGYSRPDGIFSPAWEAAQS